MIKAPQMLLGKAVSRRILANLIPPVFPEWPSHTFVTVSNDLALCSKNFLTTFR